MAQQLSPAALAVWEAFNQDEAGVFVDYGEKLAAALYAAADQVGPSEDCPKRTPNCDRLIFQDRFARWHQASLAHQQLRAIARELNF